MSNCTVSGCTSCPLNIGKGIISLRDNNSSRPTFSRLYIHFIMTNQAETPKNNLRKRNIHRPAEALEMVETEESGDTNVFTTLIPKSLRQCIAGEEKDMTQDMLLTPKKNEPDTPTVAETISDANSDANSASSSTQLSDTDSQNDKAAHPDVDDTSEEGPLNNSVTCTTVSSSGSDSSNLDSEYDYETSDNAFSFLTFRLSYLFVTLVVMLADGLQGKNIGWRRIDALIGVATNLYESCNLVAHNML